MVERSRYITIRASDDEISMLHALAEAAGVTGSDFLRMYIRRAYAEKFGEKKPKTKR